MMNLNTHRDKPWARWASRAAWMGAAATFLAGGTLACGLLLQPALEGESEQTGEWAPRGGARGPDTVIDPSNPVVIAQEVDYSEGSAAPWWPKGEAVALQELVAEGVLPPVAERVGEEPLVLRGTDGIGKHGGTLTRNIPNLGEFIRLGNRFAGSTLVRASPHGRPIVPHVAKSFEASDDLREYTFHLRRGMRWSDGHPFTANDILYWWENEILYSADGDSSIDPVPDFMKTGGEAGFLEKIDDHTLRFVFPEPHALFLEMLVGRAALNMTQSPAHYRRPFHPKLGDPELIAETMRRLKLPSQEAVYDRISHPRNPEHPQLWPWVYRTYRASPPYSAVRNPYYFAVDPQGNQLPYIDRLFWQVKDPEMLSISASSGEVDMQEMYLPFRNYALYASQQEKFGYKLLHWLPAARSNFALYPNLNYKVDPEDPTSAWKRRLLNEKRFRQALSLAIDRQAIIDTVFAGLGEPSQVAPGPDSPYFYPQLNAAYVQHDPERAERMLDALGLERKESGYRTFPDGSRMQFSISATPHFPLGAVELIVDSWARVGVRATLKTRSEPLLFYETAAMEHEFAVWPSRNDQIPPLDPRPYLPTDRFSPLAPAWSLWYLDGGLRGEGASSAAGGEPIPPGHPFRRALRLFEQVKQTPELERRIHLFHRIFDIAAENVWTISIATSHPEPVIVSEDLRNVPETVVTSWNYLSPSNGGLETWSFENPSPSRAEIDVVKNAVAEVTPWPEYDGKSGGKGYQSWLRGLLMATLVAALLLIGKRHPLVGKRLAHVIPMLLVISLGVFSIVQLPPGDFMSYRISQLEASGEPADLRKIEDLKEVFWMDEPFWDRYLHWMGVYWFAGFEAEDKGLLQGYLGRSMETNDLVSKAVGDRLWLTIAISGGSILITWLIALPVGIYSAVRQYSIGDYLATTLGFIGMCVPNFLLAILLSYFCLEWFGFSVTGLFSSEYASQPGWSWGKLADLMKRIWVPIVILGTGGAAAMMRVIRGNLLDELRKPYVTTARAKGARPGRVILKYPVRLALNPFISGIGQLFPQLVSGGAIVAMVLSLPTVGPLLLSSLMSEDIYMSASMLLALSLLGILGTLVSDLLLLALDPRIRMEGHREA